MKSQYAGPTNRMLGWRTMSRPRSLTTRRNSRIAIAWQATLLAIVGLVVGVPLGVLTGRLLWQELADNLPVVRSIWREGRRVA